MNPTICKWTLSAVGVGLGFASVVHAEELKVGKPENERLAAIERNVGGRLGVAILDTGNSRGLEYRASERFPMCSTFKFLAAAAVLRRVDLSQERLDRRISYGPADLLTWAPVAKGHVNEGSMTLSDICAAAIDYSDNTAANLILKSIGGPEGLTGYLRSLGDPITRLDRNEPELNTALEGDQRDTTTPASMLHDMQVLLLGDKLSAVSRQQLEAWLVANKTGDQRLRAGLPKDWRVGDKTGTGNNGAWGDIAIVRPPNREPILMIVYLHGSSAPEEKLNEVFSTVGKLVMERF